MLCVAYSDQGSLDASEELFVKAHDIDPSDVSVHQHYGRSASVSAGSDYFLLVLLLRNLVRRAEWLFY